MVDSLLEKEFVNSSRFDVNAFSGRWGGGVSCWLPGKFVSPFLIVLKPETVKSFGMGEFVYIIYCACL